MTTNPADREPKHLCLHDYPIRRSSSAFHRLKSLTLTGLNPTMIDVIYVFDKSPNILSNVLSASSQPSTSLSTEHIHVGMCTYSFSIRSCGELFFIDILWCRNQHVIEHAIRNNLVARCPYCGIYWEFIVLPPAHLFPLPKAKLQGGKGGGGVCRLHCCQQTSERL